MTKTKTGPIIGDLSIDLGDGTILSDRTDIGLATQWARHTIGADAFDAMTIGQRTPHVADALAELRRTYWELAEAQDS